MNALSPLASVQSPAPEGPDYVARALEERMGQAPAAAVIGAAFGRYGDRFALVSSFGSESAVLLHIASTVSKDIPILFLDTGKLFGETKRYRDHLVDLLGFRDVRVLSPDEKDIAAEDPQGSLWHENPNRCCFIRKVKPLHQALEGFDAWASGRKRYHGGERGDMPMFEESDGRVKVNPLADWSRKDIEEHMARYDLPAHPLVAEGFASIGCMPCTDRVDSGEDLRAGRWRGQSKIECGIHRAWQENLELFDEGGGI